MNYIGISYIIKNKAINNQLQKTENSVIISGATSYYFTNPITALAVCQYLNRKNRNFNYKLIQLPKEIIKEKIYIKRYEDFINHVRSNNNPQTYTEQEMDK